MARSKVSRHRVSASSILEVVVSMVIIVMVLGISMMIYTNVMRLSLSVKRLKAQFALQQVMLKIGRSANDQQQPAPTNELTIEQEIKPYEAGTTLQQVHLTAYDGNHEKIAELNKVILLDQHE
jgi:Tfp pilus assembly protein PilV